MAEQAERCGKTNMKAVAQTGIPVAGERRGQSAMGIAILSATTATPETIRSRSQPPP
jgi:hypothetical protein